MPDAAAPAAGRATAAGGYVFELPSLGADMETGTVLQWYVEVGDTVARGDVVALVSTEKADIDVEIWHGGQVAEHLVEVGVPVPVGTALLRLERVGAPAAPGTRAPSTPPAASAPTPTAPTPTPTRTPAPTPTSTTPTPTPTPTPTAPTPMPMPDSPPAPLPGRVPTMVAATAPPPPKAQDSAGSERPLSSPLARVLASERGVDLAVVAGTGPDGAVTARDVLAATATPVPAVAATDEPVDPAQAMRRAIATRMERANREIPHYHLDLDIDLTDTLARLEQHNAARPVEERVLPAALLAWATARAAARVPELNGHWLDGGLRSRQGVDLGVVISLRRGGLLTPTIVGADTLDLAQLMVELRNMVMAARTGALRSSWMAEASLTVTILGDNGADRVSGVIFPPQVALVGFGRIRQRPGFDAAGAVVARSWVTATLAADHRATDGAMGSRFLAALARTLDEPFAAPETPRRDQ